MDWLKGKKTIIAGALIALAAIAGVGLGHLTPEMGVALVGAGLGVAGLAEKFNRHQAEMIAVLNDVAKAGSDYRAGNHGAIVGDVLKTSSDAMKLRSAVEPEFATKIEPGAVHLAGDLPGSGPLNQVAGVLGKDVAGRDPGQ